MFGSSAHNLTVDVYRPASTGNTWGDRDENVNDGGLVAPTLAGKALVHTIEEAIVGPTKTAGVKTSDEASEMVVSEYILYCDVEEDIRAGDYIAYHDPRDRLMVMRVMGDGDTNYFSPYTGISVKEVPIDAVKLKQRK